MVQKKSGFYVYVNLFYGLLIKCTEFGYKGGWVEAGVRKWRKGGGWGQKREEGWRMGSEKGGRVEAGVRNGRKGGAWGQKKL